MMASLLHAYKSLGPPVVVEEFAIAGLGKLSTRADRHFVLMVHKRLIGSKCSVQWSSAERIDLGLERSGNLLGILTDFGEGLDGRITVERLAKVSGWSERHLHRLLKGSDILNIGQRLALIELNRDEVREGVAELQAKRKQTLASGLIFLMRLGSATEARAERKIAERRARRQGSGGSESGRVNEWRKGERQSDVKSDGAEK